MSTIFQFAQSEEWKVQFGHAWFPDAVGCSVIEASAQLTEGGNHDLSKAADTQSILGARACSMTMFVPSAAGDYRSKIFLYGRSLDQLYMVCASVPVTQSYFDFIRPTGRIAAKLAFKKTWQELFDQPSEFVDCAEKRGFEIVANNYLVEFQSGDA